MANFADLMEKGRKIAILSHTSPDADALCSSFALKNIIHTNFKDKMVDVFCASDISELYNPILKDENINPQPFSAYDIVFVLDCPDLKRVGDSISIAENTPIVVNIDHHETNEKFGTINISSSYNSSTCEIIYILAMANKLKINDLIAKQLYQGIITDTNCFTNFSTSKTTHQVVSELLKYNFDADAIKEYYFKNNTLPKTKLIAQAFKSLKFYEGERFTTMKIPYEVFEKVGAGFEDTYGIVDNGINISGAEASAILIETLPSKVYVSLRSRGNVDVGEVAKQFGGGGSATIAAYQSNNGLKETEASLVEAISPLLPPEEEKHEITF